NLGEQDAMVIDETGGLEKGGSTVGVQRQYTGTAGRIGNSQMSVFVVYSTSAGHIFIDRELYLPAGWVTGDEAYGKDAAGLRDPLGDREQAYVLAVACDHRITDTAPRRPRRRDGWPKRVWQELSAGAGAKGRRYCLWARIRLRQAGKPGQRWMLMRRNRRTGETAFYRCYSPRPASLAELARVAGRRWTIEETFQTGKELTGLDEHQVRTWTSWYRWTTLVMLAHAFLAITAAHARTDTEQGLISLTRNEIRHLYSKLVLEPTHTTTDIPAWSIWHRGHQHRARLCHYQRRPHTPPA
ncbi:IS701 family transposase, partial [Amycolatopsis rubida]